MTAGGHRPWTGRARSPTIIPDRRVHTFIRLSANAGRAEPDGLITGGSDGLGKGMAMRFADSGADVAIQGVSSALEVGDDYWVGTFNGDRVAYFPKGSE